MFRDTKLNPEEFSKEHVSESMQRFKKPVNVWKFDDIPGQHPASCWYEFLQEEPGRMSERAYPEMRVGGMARYERYLKGAVTLTWSL